MEKELEQFRQEVQRLRAGRRAGSGPFPEAMKSFAVRYLAEAQRAGRTMKEVAKELRVSEPTLQAWRRGEWKRREAAPAPKLVPVGVREEKVLPEPQAAARQPVTVVSPQGWRVEGLRLEDAAELLRRLAC